MSSVDDERALLGYLLQHPEQFDDVVYGNEQYGPIGALNFSLKAHRQLFAMIRAFHVDNGNLQYLSECCEAQPLRAKLEEIEEHDLINSVDWGWFEAMGGEEWLLDLWWGSPADIALTLGQFLEASERVDPMRIAGDVLIKLAKEESHEPAY